MPSHAGLPALGPPLGSLPRSILEVLLNPTVSVVIPVHDDSVRLATCLRALREQTYPRGAVEIVVVDNNSTEDIAAVVRHDPGVVLVRERRTGSYAARNAGLEVASGEVLAFTDSDCVPDPEWLAEGIAALVREPVAAMVGGAVELFFRAGRPVSAAELYESLHAFQQEVYLSTEQFAVTANMLTWSEVIDRVGPFDARLASRGDAELGQRVARSGGIQRYASGAVVRHPARETTREVVTKSRRTTAGRIDADHHASRAPWHFVRLALRQVRSAARTLGGQLVPGREPVGAGPTLRYLALFLYVRAQQTSMFAAAAVHAGASGIRGRRRGT